MRLLTLFLTLVLLCPSAMVNAKPVDAQIGAYVTGLRDLDMKAKTFDADIWWWAVTPEAAENPLKTMEFIKAKSANTGYDSVQTVDGRKWFQVKLSGTFHKDWDLRKYPFDRQVLSIFIEEAITDVNGLTYDIDAQNSSINPSIKIAGWKIVDFRLRPTPAKHKTTFGDPSLENGSSTIYAAAVLEMVVERNEFMSFVQLTTPAYLAFLISLLTFFMKPDNTSLNSPRYSILVGSLFLIVINLRSANEQIGTMEGIGLVQAIHLWAMAMVLIVTIACVFTQRQLEAGTPLHTLNQLNSKVSKLVLFSFVTINAYLLYATSL